MRSSPTIPVWMRGGSGAVCGESLMLGIVYPECFGHAGSRAQWPSRQGLAYASVWTVATTPVTSSGFLPEERVAQSVRAYQSHGGPRSKLLCWQGRAGPMGSDQSDVAEVGPGTISPDALAAAIVSSSSDAIVACDLAGRVLLWNQAAEALYGYAAAEMIGRAIQVLAPPDRAADLD